MIHIIITPIAGRHHSVLCVGAIVIVTWRILAYRKLDHRIGRQRGLAPPSLSSALGGMKTEPVFLEILFQSADFQFGGRDEVEDPLDDALRGESVGEVTGGGSGAGMANIDIEVTDLGRVRFMSSPTPIKPVIVK